MSRHIKTQASQRHAPEQLDLQIFVCAGLQGAIYLTGREPVMRMSTSPPGALLPARTGRYMGDSDQRSKEVKGVEIAS